MKTILSILVISIIFMLSACGASKPEWTDNPNSALSENEKQSYDIIKFKIKVKDESELNKANMSKLVFVHYARNLLKDPKIKNIPIKNSKNYILSISTFVSREAIEKNKFYDKETKTYYFIAMVPKDAIKRAVDNYYSGNNKKENHKGSSDVDPIKQNYIPSSSGSASVENNLSEASSCNELGISADYGIQIQIIKSL